MPLGIKPSATLILEGKAYPLQDVARDGVKQHQLIQLYIGKTSEQK